MSKQVTVVDLAQLARLLVDPVIKPEIVDIRSRADFAAGHIPGAWSSVYKEADEFLFRRRGLSGDILSKVGDQFVVPNAIPQSAHVIIIGRDRRDFAGYKAGLVMKANGFSNVYWCRDGMIKWNGLSGEYSGRFLVEKSPGLAQLKDAVLKTEKTGFEAVGASFSSGRTEKIDLSEIGESVSDVDWGVIQRVNTERMLLFQQLHLYGDVIPLDQVIDLDQLDNELKAFEKAWVPYNAVGAKKSNPREGLSVTSLDGGMSGVPDLFRYMSGQKKLVAKFRSVISMFQRRPIDIAQRFIGFANRLCRMSAVVVSFGFSRVAISHRIAMVL